MITEEELRKNPKPWFTTDSIAFIEEHLDPQYTVIEFGGGWSSIWWAKRAKYTLTVEASPGWAERLIKEMIPHPDAMAKWSLKFVPSDWNPNPSNLKQYWKTNKAYLDETNISNLTSRYLDIDFTPDVFVIDGSVRCLNIDAVDEFLDSKHEKPKMIVIDNTEVYADYAVGKFNGFKQYDFHEKDTSLIPEWQNGAWCTSVWIKE